MGLPIKIGGDFLRNAKYRLKNYMAAVAAIAACAIVLSHSGQSAEAVRLGIEMCAGSVIPSLFPMMFLAQYFIKSGGAEEIGGLLEVPTRIFFGLPGICGAVILTGFIGGYPSGAAAAETLVQRGAISRREGERLANIAFCSGPGFTIGMIGAQLYKNKSVGLLILTAQVISCIIIGIALRLVAGNAIERPAIRANAGHTDNDGGKNAFVESASAASSAVLAMCSFIILFQVINAMLDTLGIGKCIAMIFAKMGLAQWGQYLLPCVTEVTGGSMLSVNVGLPFTAFVAGFGGLSVHFQNFALCRSIRPNKARYLFTRLVQGGLCSLLVSAALKIPFFAEKCVSTASFAGTGIPTRFSSISGSFGAVMLVMCLMSVLCLPQNQKERRENEPFKALR